MLHDRARIHVQAGAGGNGSTSFRREAHVPRGGPDGGDGGHGGAVVFVCDDSLRDLQGFRRKTHYSAGRGGHGEGSQRHGADGETLTIRVPPGTRIAGSEEDDGELAGRRWELLADGQRATVARGGRGGKGNKRFATPTRQAPRFAERGLAGEQGWLELQLRLLADAGLVGLPNAGKSSLLARLTRATPKIAGYPFTTLSPVLGVLDGPERQLIIADIPGLIEGASEGAGLGHEFLAHVERTRLLVHVLDIAPELSGEEGSDPVANYAIIERELAAHDQQLARLPRVLALSKADLVTPERVAEALAQWRERLGPGVPVLATSSATGAGLDELAAALLHGVAPQHDDAVAGRAGAEGAVGSGRAPGAGANGLAGVATGPGRDTPGGGAAGGGEGEEQLAEHMVFRPSGGGGFHVERLGPGAFAVRGRGIERLLERYDIENEDAMAYVEGRLRRIGVLKALEAEGFQPGDEIEIGGVTFELDPRSAG
ncbi:MAG TPA: GTPase ObgE [Solirubrobacteraceae bacterium]|jgi:GTP-binding protein|nr:GTPase ObgE [Solirubrobacteraceae bacterium]